MSEYITAYTLYNWLYKAMRMYGKDIPVVFENLDPGNRILIAPCKHLEIANLVDPVEHDQQRVVVIAQSEKPFPDDVFTRDA